MTLPCNRRAFLRLAGAGAGAVFASGLPGWAAARDDDFFFVQLSDSHWGFQGAANPDARGTLPRAVAAVNALPREPDFIMFTGDLTHSTDDPAERRKRMREFQAAIAPLKAGQIHLMPGEHDASLDNGEAYRELFGPTHYTFDHKGLHAIVLDNVSDPTGQVGDAQRQWLADDLSKQPRDARIVVFTHRPLFNLYPQWDWATRDGDRVVELLMPYQNVTVFYGHIHQEHHHLTGHIEHHAARSLMFPLPPPGSQPRREPLPWDAAQPYRGLGWREVTAMRQPAGYRLAERPVSDTSGGES